MPTDPLAEALALLTAWLDGDETCATLQHARAWVDARRAAAAPPAERRNCLTCRFRDERLGVEYCGHPEDGNRALTAWVDRTHRVDAGGWLRCPPDADGCPGWQPTDPPPSADYQGPGWPDGVGRG